MRLKSFAGRLNIHEGDGDSRQGSGVLAILAWKILDTLNWPVPDNINVFLNEENSTYGVIFIL